MGIRSTFRGLIGKGEPPVPAIDELVTIAPDPRGAPGSRVHHEIILGELDGDGKWPWLCRVYAQNGAATERNGEADTERAAQNAALSWAAITKAGLRGGV